MTVRITINCECGQCFTVHDIKGYSVFHCPYCDLIYARKFDPYADDYIIVAENEMEERQMVHPLDVVLTLPVHIEKAQYIFRKISEIISNQDKSFYPFHPEIKIIAVGGQSGVGKTEICLELKRMFTDKLRKKVKIFHFDFYYKASPDARNEERRRTGIIGKDEIDWQKLDHNIDQMYGQYDVIMLDGLYALYYLNNLDYGTYLEGFDYGVYLEGNEKDTYDFRKQRGKENPDSKFRQFVLEKEKNCIVQSRGFANLIVPFKL